MKKKLSAVDILERSWHPAALTLLCITLLAGGGGSGFPRPEMTVELLALGVLAMQACTPSFRDALGVRLATFLAAVALLPLLQLVPLPDGLWRALPGHDTAATIADVAGLAPAWRPMTLTPFATERSFMSLFPAAAIFLATMRADDAERRNMMICVLSVCTIGAVLGAAQLAGGEALDPFSTPHSDASVGLFANRNHQADMMMIGILFSAAIGVGTGSTALRPLAIGGVALFAIGVVTTTSRMGLLLLPLALLGAVLILTDASRQRTAKAIIAAVALILLAMLLATNSSVFQAVLDRFHGLEDDRFIYWRDTIPAIWRFLPFGSGLGSFVPIYAAGEALESVLPRFVNHAHNDYLELLLETGLPGFALLLVALAVLVRNVVRKVPQAYRIQHRAAAFVLAVLLLHSLVDYPLRTLALMTLFAFAAGLTFTPKPRRQRRRAPTVDLTAEPLQS